MTGFLDYYGFKEAIPNERFKVTVFNRQSEVVHRTETKTAYT